MVLHVFRGNLGLKPQLEEQQRDDCELGTPPTATGTAGCANGPGTGTLPPSPRSAPASETLTISLTRKCSQRLVKFRRKTSLPWPSAYTAPAKGRACYSLKFTKNIDWSHGSYCSILGGVKAKAYQLRTHVRLARFRGPYTLYSSHIQRVHTV